MFDRGWRIEGYRITPFAEQDIVSGADVAELWLRESAVAPAEAQRRVEEILLVGIDDAGRPAGVSTAYLQHNRQLGAMMWYYRAFVAAAYRHSDIAVILALMGRDYLSRRYFTGEDRRAIGVVYEIENPGLRRYFPHAHWLPTDFVFINQNESGAHVRVHYFVGAPAPPPPAPDSGATYGSANDSEVVWPSGSASSG